jgi:multiple sugar transport system permease protein
MMVPAMAIMGGLVLFPLFNGIRMSFTNASPLKPDTHWVGLENFAYLFEDREFGEVIYNSVFIIGSSTILSLVIGFAIALLLNSGIRGAGFFRAAIFQVWIVPWIVIAILWGWLYNSDFGLINHILMQLGILREPVNWLFNEIPAQITIITGYTWRSIPFMMVVSLAALQSIPKEIMEAASIDGAGFFRRVVYIIIPLMRNILMVLALVQAVRLIQDMTLPWVLTHGGPINSTMTISMYTFKLAFDSWDFGLASAVGTLWLFVLILLAAISMRTLSRNTN